MNLFEDISHWEEQNWYNSGGTRNKKILSNPDGLLYYFKESFKNDKGKFYKYEFYSEVIASYLGEILGLHVLKYTIAVYGAKIGCISRNMLESDEELIEGKSYLRAIDNTFMADEKRPKSNYHYHLIQKAYYFMGQGKNLNAFHDLLFFDALIGNSDRHQENWGFIEKNTILSNTMDKALKDLSSEERKIFRRMFEKLSSFFNAKMPKEQDLERLMYSISRFRKFAPIYDSGCCLGRELDEDVVKNKHKDEAFLSKYIEKGASEIYWHGKKISHFDLLKNIFSEYPDLKKRYKILVERINTEKLIEFIGNLDRDIPEGFSEYKISNERKQLIVNIITLRTNKIKQILSE